MVGSPPFPMVPDGSRGVAPVSLGQVGEAGGKVISDVGAGAQGGQAVC